MKEQEKIMEEELQTFSTNEGVFLSRTTKKFENRKVWAEPNPKMISASIPGTVLDVYIKAGQSVKKGETLLLLEAMKMQNQIAMPFDGKIKKVYVKAEEKIPKNHLMVEIA